MRWEDELDAWVLMRHRDVARALTDPRFQADRLESSEILERLGFPELVPVHRLLEQTMLFYDPPAHTRLRELVSPGVTGRAVSAVRPLIEEVAEALLDRALREPRFDIVADFARPLPTLVAAELFGLPLEERDVFRAWWYEAFALLEGTVPEDELRRRGQALLELTERLRLLVSSAARDRPSRVIGVVAASEVAGGRLGMYQQGLKQQDIATALGVAEAAFRMIPPQTLHPEWMLKTVHLILIRIKNHFTQQKL